MKRIYAEYSESGDMTFILEDIINDNGDVVSTEVKGFYFGEPNEEDTLEFYGSLKAEFE